MNGSANWAVNHQEKGTRSFHQINVGLLRWLYCHALKMPQILWKHEFGIYNNIESKRRRRQQYSRKKFQPLLTFFILYASSVLELISVLYEAWSVIKGTPNCGRHRSSVKVLVIFQLCCLKDKARTNKRHREEIKFGKHELTTRDGNGFCQSELQIRFLKTVSICYITKELR